MLKRFRVSQLISWRRLLSVYFLHHPFRLSPARWLCAALLPLCPRLTSPVSLIVKVPVGLMLKRAFFPPLHGVDNTTVAECVEEERCVDLFFSAG